MRNTSARLWSGAPEGTFAALGHNNNKLFVIPEWRMVVVRLGLDQKERKITDLECGEFIRLLGESLGAAASAGASRTSHP